MTFIFAALLLVGRHLPVRRSALFVMIVLGLTAYAMIAGAAPSIWRATAFGVLATLGLLCGRDLDTLSLWGAALLGLLIVDPALAWSLSLQLTFAAVWGLLCLSPVFFRVIKRVSAGFWGQLAAMSLGAQSATIPLSLLHFGTASPAGLGANFLAVPLAGVLVLAGALALVVPLADSLYVLTRGVADLARFAAHPLGAQVQDVSLRGAYAFGVYSAFLLAAIPLSDEWNELRAALRFWLERRRRQLLQLDPRRVVMLLGLLALGATAWALWPRPSSFRLTVLDVGQGACVLVQDPSGRAALVDGGSVEGANRADIGASVIVPALRELGVERLDFVVLSNPGAEHCNGLKRVLNELPVGAFVDGAQAGEPRNDPVKELLGGNADLDEVRREIARHQIPLLVPQAGQTLSLGQTQLQVLGPTSPPMGSQNDRSLALRVAWQGRSVLLLSDLEREGAQRLVQRGEPVRCDAMLVAGHGLLTAYSPELLRAAAPGAAIVSCGRYNQVGAPSPRVLDAFARQKVALFRTDLDGAVTVECDQNACRVTPTNP